MTEVGAIIPAAVAVSGGADSTALMLLLGDWAKRHGQSPPTVLTVDHGLRPGSRKEADRVKKLAEERGLHGQVLVWKGEKPKSDIEAEARSARYALMGGWCAEHKVSALYVGHTLEDQAETFLLRLARGSGLDGLAGMQPVSSLPLPKFSDIQVVRPLLRLGKEPLRHYLASQKVSWVEDPMNNDPQFARTRIRAAWPNLEELGLTPQRIADAAAHLGRARAALEELTDAYLRRGTAPLEDGMAMDSLRLKMVPREIGLRALATVLARISGQEFRPRFQSLERLFDSILSGSLGRGATLHGCIVATALPGNQPFGLASITVLRETGRKPREPAPPLRRRR